MTAQVRVLEPADWPAAGAIYDEGIRSGDATFETAPPEWDEFDRTHLPLRLVATEHGRILGWAGLSPVSSRCVYAGVAEVSVYVAEAARGRGVGRTLLQELVSRSEAEGIWTLEAGIFPENAASIALHERCGFRRVGVRERLGRMGGGWRDVLLLERRSPVL
ncbi:MAG: N-acetyltransferase family protein [Gaiellaceae bacterium]